MKLINIDILNKSINEVKETLTSYTRYILDKLSRKQDKLTAGENIEIKDNVISAKIHESNNNGETTVIQKVSGSQEKIYDFALWLRKFAGRGSNAIAFFGIDGSGKIKENVFRGSLKNFLLLVGTMKASTEKQYYSGTVNRQSILQGMDTRPGDYRIFIYMPVICNYFYKTRNVKVVDVCYKEENLNTNGYNTGIRGFWEWYRLQCANHVSLQLQYKIADGEYQTCFFHFLNHSRVFSFYRTKDEWIKLFDTYGDDIEITIYDPMGHYPADSYASNNYLHHSIVLFAGFKNGYFGFFKRVFDTFDMRKRLPFNIKPLYNVYCKPLEKIWHMEPIKDHEVKCKRHMLKILYFDGCNGSYPYILRSSYRIYQEDERFNLESQKKFLMPTRIVDQSEDYRKWQYVLKNSGSTPLERVRLLIDLYDSVKNPNFLIRRYTKARNSCLPRSYNPYKYVYPYVGGSNGWRKKNTKWGGRGDPMDERYLLDGWYGNVNLHGKKNLVDLAWGVRTHKKPKIRKTVYS